MIKRTARTLEIVKERRPAKGDRQILEKPIPQIIENGESSCYSQKKKEIGKSVK